MRLTVRYVNVKLFANDKLEFIKKAKVISEEPKYLETLGGCDLYDAKSKTFNWS